MLNEKELPDGASTINLMTDEELTQAESRVFSELETKDEEDLTIYLEEDLTEEEKLDLPEGSLMRESAGTIFVKVMDIWMPYMTMSLKQPPQYLVSP